MSLHIGQELGSYEITSLVGKGGMGEVYRAHDTKLKRDVAIKVLHEAFSNDMERVARFHREAEVLASINHPNIAAIYGLEPFGESRCLILELVEGATLSDRIAHGPIPVNEALSIAVQIAEALEATHKKGITHRDLKPANIKLTPEGMVKVLDFGLAKARAAQSDLDLSNSPTILTASMTAVVLGTPGYVPPEQVDGKETDHTADVWAFGCVLYEMLTGRPAFEGQTMGQILAAVMKSEPSWERLPPKTPERIRRLLARCLRKDRRRRLQHMTDVRLEIEDDDSGDFLIRSSPQPAGTRLRETLAWIGALIIVVLIAATAIAHDWSKTPTAALPSNMRFIISTPPLKGGEASGAKAVSLEISPDGKQIAFVADDKGISRLWICSLDCVSVPPRALPATDNALYPFWAPDGHSIGFFADAKLKRVDLDNGVVKPLANATNPRGGDWSGDTILFAPATAGTPVFRVSAAGGEATAVTQLHPPQERGHLYPRFLPDGHHFLYYVNADGEAGGVYVGAIDGAQGRRLIAADAAAEYSGGQLLFIQRGALFAQNCDPVGLTLTGSPTLLADKMRVDGFRGALSASAAGSIAYRSGSDQGIAATNNDGPTLLMRVNRSGKEISRFPKPARMQDHWAVTRDGRMLAFEEILNGKWNISLFQLATGALFNVTRESGADYFPVWSPDGKHIAFSSTRKGHQDLFVIPTTGGQEELLLATDQNKIATDWSADGRFLLYRNFGLKTAYDIWALPLDPSGKPGQPFPAIATNDEERDGQLSFDGRWIAYQSNASGKFEIYVQPFSGKASQSGSRWNISKEGGTQPRWRLDGKELFYIAGNGQLMAVPIHLPSDGQDIVVDTAVPLFDPRISGAIYGNRQQYAVSPKGDEFLLNTFAETQASSAQPISLILNWKRQP